MRRRQRVAAFVAAVFGLAYVACVFAWEIKWGHDLMRRELVPVSPCAEAPRALSDVRARP